MTEKRLYGHTSSGKPITDEVIDELAGEAATYYVAEKLIARRGKRGRPRLGSAPASVDSVRLDPELPEKLLGRAEVACTTASEIIREALRPLLRAA